MTSGVKSLKLHLGSGSNNLAGWVNIDLDSPSADLNLDLRLGLPYKTGAVDFIYSEHFIEHISREDGQLLLQECARVIKPTGTIRLSTPSLSHIVRSYITREISAWGDLWQPSDPCEMLNQAFRFWGHEYLYDPEKLADTLYKAGFNNIRRVRWQESEIPELNALESRPFHSEIILEANRNCEIQWIFFPTTDKDPQLETCSTEELLHRRVASLEQELEKSSRVKLELAREIESSKKNHTYIADLLRHINNLEAEIDIKNKFITHLEEAASKEEQEDYKMKKEKQEQYLLSIILITYNHEKYIKKALDGLFFQRFSGKVEIIVADDHSTDNTVEVIKSMASTQEKYDFKFLESEQNLGITKNYRRAFSACSGHYVAILEGDDYWISRDKLNIQVDYLENHLESDLCSSNYYVFDEQRSDFSPRCHIENKIKCISARELIFDNIVGNFSTCVYRRSALESLPPELFEIESYDWIVNICVARHSLIAFIPQPLSVYRVHSNGAWSKATHLGKLQLQLSLIPSYDRLSNEVFHEDFEKLSIRLQQAIAVLEMEKVVHEEPAIIQKSLPALVRLAMSPKLSPLRTMLPARAKKVLDNIISGRKQ